MIDFTDVQDAIYDWIHNETGYEAIWDEQNAPEQSRPYFLINIISVNAIGHDWISSPDVGSGLGEILGDRELRADIQFFGTSKRECLSKHEALMSSLEKPAVQIFFQERDIAFVNREPVTDLSDLVDKRYKYKTQSEARFRIGQSIDDELGVIQQVQLEENSISLETITINRLIAEGD